MDVEVGNEPPLSPGLTLFLAEGAAKEWDDAPSPSTPMPVKSPWLPPMRAPTALPMQKGLSLKSQPNHPLVDPSPNLNQNQKKDQIL